MTLFEMYKRFPNGCDNFGKWGDFHVELYRRFPLTSEQMDEAWFDRIAWLREMFARHPLGCAEFGAEWCELWKALGRVLLMPAKVELCCPINWTWQESELIGQGVVSSCVCDTIARPSVINLDYRVDLHDGTIVKEWISE
jgi:hypothetical protein